RTTDDHPFFVLGRGWVNAGELAIGDLVQQSDGSTASVIASQRESHPLGITVYNLEVEGAHTYFVTDGQGEVTAVWVHNAKYRVRNKWGRRGSPAHRARITAAEAALAVRGWRTISGGSLPE